MAGQSGSVSSGNGVCGSGGDGRVISFFPKCRCGWYHIARTIGLQMLGSGVVF